MINYIDSNDEKFKKRFDRFLQAKDEMLEIAQQLEHDLSYFGDYIDSAKLLHASIHAEAIYNIIKEVSCE